MKNIRNLAILAGLVLVLGALFAAAQAPSGLVLNVPFSFWVEHQQFPSGEYRIQNIQAGRLLIRSTDGKSYTTVLTIPVRGKAPEGSGKVVFHRYENQYFLAQVWTPAQEIGRQAFESRQELELTKRQKQQEVVLVPGAGGAQ